EPSIARAQTSATVMSPLAAAPLSTMPRKWRSSASVTDFATPLGLPSKPKKNTHTPPGLGPGRGLDGNSQANSHSRKGMAAAPASAMIVARSMRRRCTASARRRGGNHLEEDLVALDHAQVDARAFLD